MSHETLDVPHRPEATVQRLFAEQAARTPDAIAVLSERDSLTYAALDALANRIARRLRARGVRRDVPVAICVERSTREIAALLGILKAGGAYLPLEPSYPAERLAFMVRDAGATLLVTERSLASRMPALDGTTLFLEEMLDAADDDRALEDEGASSDRAYIMYTSGSTGTPKGVEITHRSINRLVCAVDYVELGPVHTLLHAAPLGFDASTFELWGALLTGGRCAIHPEPVPTADGIGRAIQRFGVTTMWLTAGLFNAIIDEAPEQLRGLRQLLTGGEALSAAHVRRALSVLEGTQLINGYGPTETTTFAATYRIPRDLPADATSIPIGRPIRETRLYVLDEARRPVADGEIGELYIGGEGLARGYLGRPDLTRERFLPDPFTGRAGDRMYRTGDLVRVLPDGCVDYVGRADGQVKISGYRIELGEIEAALSRHAAVRSCRVIARSAGAGAPKRLVAYVVAAPDAAIPGARELRELLHRSLPDYMVPAVYVPLAQLPLTANGKVDDRALPEPDARATEPDEGYAAPRTPTERVVADVWAALLGVPRVSVFANVFELGASSLLAVKAHAQLRTRHAMDVPIARLFECPTVAELAASIDQGGAGTAGGHAASSPDGATAGRQRARHAGEPVAIIGMAARYPGAGSVDELWRNLCAGVESITFFRDDELDPLARDTARRAPRYVPARGVLPDVDRFDAGFFGMTPREAQLMDPQQRIFLELAWEALEHAGYVPEAFDGPIGVFGGVYNNSYAATVLVRRPALVEQYGAFNAMLLNEKDYVATRTAHKLGLTGPALSIHTACSTSLVAICQAVQSLRDGQCGMALAGGVSLTIPTMSGYPYQEGGMLSADGHTRTFDASATGTVFSDGAGIVVLKRLEDAERDGDTIYAVLRGVALNNDGANKASFTAPSVSGQAAVITSAHADAEVDARSISYVEAHGTATPLGDPIEVEALTQAFRASTPEVGFCAIGSVKSNIGHTVTAAGAAGVIKTALALRHEVIPASLHYDAPNPHLALDDSPFVVAARPMAWPRGAAPRRAGVSSFGVGGTNAHVVMEEAPLAEPAPSSRPAQLLVLSARSREALDAAAARLAAALRAAPEMPVADVAHTLQRGRRAFPHRRAIVCTSAADAAAQLETREARSGDAPAPALPPQVAFLFPGQGSQYVRMGATLYACEPVFRAELDRCADVITDILGGDLRRMLFDPMDEESAARALRETSLTQPALFAIEFALAKLWESWGVRPSAMIGHSVGEFVCAALAGVFSPEDGARLVAARGRLMQELPPGSMLSVRLPASVLLPRLDPALAIAAENAPSLCVVSGPTPLVAALEETLTAEGVACRRLHTSHAFHSSMMDPAIEPLVARVSAMRLSSPRLPFASSVTGGWITEAQARDPVYWARHLRETVRFSDGVRTVGAGAQLLLEVGPRATLATLARQQLTGAQAPRCVSSLGAAEPEEYPSLLAALGQLWTRGVAPEWAAVHAGERRRRIALPTYPFERRRHWVDAEPDGAQPAAAAVPEAMPASASLPEPAAMPQGVAPVAARNSSSSSVRMTSPQSSSARRDRLSDAVAGILEQVSGIEVGRSDASTTFVELGFDSLTLTQVALALSKEYATKITFRQLLEQYSTLDLLVRHLEELIPPEPETAPVAIVSQPSTPAHIADPVVPAAPLSTAIMPATNGSASGSVQWLIEQQLRIMAQQLAVLGGAPAPAPVAAPVPQPAPSAPAPAAPVPMPPAPVAASEPAGARANAAATNGNGDHPDVPSTGPNRAFYDSKKAFGAAPRISHAQQNDLTPKQRARLDAFVRRYTTRTKESKRFTQANRAAMADPRVATGFRPAVKELVYPIVVRHSAGSRMWDLDGNEYVDVLSGFGSNMFGWSAPFVVEAVKAQLDEGFEVGPQHPLTAEVTALVRDVTGAERVAFCNTGSEAVLGAIRVARTVTGRNLIVAFSGSYHGINDEVLVRGGKTGRAVPAAPGILPATAQNILVLEYGTEASLEVIRSRASEIAAVLVEPVQSRRPDFQPGAFLRDLRAVTSAAGIVYIWDEIVTGFRVAPGGAQEHFGVRADLATYGKVVGGGLPIGVIAGRREFMDALDGGHWQFGDGSVPEVGVTYFAGTFVRHPLALAAARAVLLHLKERGPALQDELAERTERLASELNTWFAAVGAPLEIRRFRSIWKTFYTAEQGHGDLLFYMLRDRGIHIYDGFPCFMTTAHSDADVTRIIAAFKEAVTELQEGDFLPGAPAAQPARVLDASAPPVPGARLGRDRDGSPAWFVPNPDARGGFVKVDAL